MAADLIAGGSSGLIPWRRRGALSELQHSMERMLHDFFDDDALLAPHHLGNGGTFVPSLELHETEDKIVLSAELPGLSEKDVKVAVDRDVLTIRGEKKEQLDEKRGGRRVTERRFGAFERSVRLPDSVDRDKIAARFDKGVLTIEVPRSADAKRESRNIPIKH